jgi:hypothetical protein
MRLIGELMLLLKRNDIDVVVLNEAIPLLRYEVVSHGKVLLDKEGMRGLLFSNFVSQWLDIKPMLDFHSKWVMESLSKC